MTVARVIELIPYEERRGTTPDAGERAKIASRRRAARV